MPFRESGLNDFRRLQANRSELKIRKGAHREPPQRQGLSSVSPTIIATPIAHFHGLSECLPRSTRRRVAIVLTNRTNRPGVEQYCNDYKQVRYVQSSICKIRTSATSAAGAWSRRRSLRSGLSHMRSRLSASQGRGPLRSGPGFRHAPHWRRATEHRKLSDYAGCHTVLGFAWQVRTGRRTGSFAGSRTPWARRSSRDLWARCLREAARPSGAPVDFRNSSELISPSS